MTVTLESPSVETTDYVAVFYRDGKRAGVEQYFYSMSDIKLYLSDSNGRMPTLTIIKSHQHIEDFKNLDGMIVEERKWLRRMGDADLRGTRIYT